MILPLRWKLRDRVAKFSLKRQRVLPRHRENRTLARRDNLADTTEKGIPRVSALSDHEYLRTRRRLLKMAP